MEKIKNFYIKFLKIFEDRIEIILLTIIAIILIVEILILGWITINNGLIIPAMLAMLFAVYMLYLYFA